MRKNCHNCDCLEYIEAEVTDPSGFCCNGREYRNEDEERKHLAQLDDEGYRHTSKKCHVPRPSLTKALTQ